MKNGKESVAAELKPARHAPSWKGVAVTLLWAMLAMLAANPVSARQIVTVQILPPPPNQLTAADMWELNLANFSATGGPAQPILVYLEGSIETRREGIVGQGTSSTVLLQPGMNRLSGRNVQPVNVTYAQSRYRDAMIRTGGFPAGEYTMCVTVHEAQSRRELGRDCIVHSVQPFSPPQLVTPVAGDVVSQPYPVFVWTPPAPAPAGAQVQYRIRVVQMRRSQPAEVAVQTNPAWFTAANLTATTLAWPADARPFEEGTYAWFVEAYQRDPAAVRDPGTGIIARSEVETFRWEPVKLEFMPGVLVATLAPHGIPLPLFQELMRPCTGTPPVPAVMEGGRVIVRENP